MSLTAQEKADVVFFLGWPGLTIVEGSTDYSKIIVDRVSISNAPIVNQVRSILTRIKNLDTKLDSASGRLAAKSIDGIELREDEIQQLKKERRRGLKELSRLLDIDLLTPSGANISVYI